MNTTQSLDQEIRKYLRSLDLETSERFTNWWERRKMRTGMKGYVGLITSSVTPSWWNLVLLPDRCQYNHVEYCLGELEYSYNIPAREPWEMRVYGKKNVSLLTSVANCIGEKYHRDLKITLRRKNHKICYWKEYRNQPEEEKEID